MQGQASVSALACSLTIRWAREMVDHSESTEGKAMMQRKFPSVTLLLLPFTVSLSHLARLPHHPRVVAFSGYLFSLRIFNLIENLSQAI